MYSSLPYTQFILVDIRQYGMLCEAALLVCRDTTLVYCTKVRVTNIFIQKNKVLRLSFKAFELVWI